MRTSERVTLDYVIGKAGRKPRTNRYVNDRTTIETRETYRHHADSETRWAAEAVYAGVSRVYAATGGEHGEEHGLGMG